MWTSPFLPRAHPGTVFGLWTTQGRQERVKDLPFYLQVDQCHHQLTPMIAKTKDLIPLSTGFPTNDPGGRWSRSLPRYCRRILCLLFHRCHQV